MQMNTTRSVFYLYKFLAIVESCFHYICSTVLFVLIMIISLSLHQAAAHGLPYSESQKKT